LNKSSVKERRAYERHDTRIDIQGTADESGAVARMVASNLSLGGLYCTSTTDFPEMTRLAVRMLLPTQASGEPQPVDVEAVVVRREKKNGANGDARYDLALYFPNLSEAARNQIERYLS
jgi:c-di-GMP-binding flagellar brake protein YcgR